MCSVEKGCEVLTEALPVEKRLQGRSHHHVGRAAFPIAGQKHGVSRLSLRLARHPEARLSETPGEHPQAPLGEMRHIKTNVRRGQYAPRRSGSGGEEEVWS